MRIGYCIIALLASSSCIAQSELSENPPLPDYNIAQMYKRNDKGMFFKEHDGKTFYISTDFTDFREYDVHHQLLQKGDASAYRRSNRLGREGKWVYYYGNGHLRAEGSYYNNSEIGLWKIYYANGKMEKQFSFAAVDDEDSYHPVIETVLSGGYKEYYPTGILKTVGFYATRFRLGKRDTTYVPDPATNSAVIKDTPPRRKCYPAPYGNWKYYSPAGKLVKTEDRGYDI